MSAVSPYIYKELVNKKNGKIACFKQRHIIMFNLFKPATASNNNSFMALHYRTISVSHHGSDGYYSTCNFCYLRQHNYNDVSFITVMLGNPTVTDLTIYLASKERH